MKFNPLIKVVLLCVSMSLVSCAYTSAYTAKLKDKYFPDSEYKAMVVKADAAMQNAEWSKAADLYEKASQMKPGDWSLKLKQAEAYQNDGKLALAFNAYDVILHANLPPSEVNNKILKTAKENQAKCGFKGDIAAAPVEKIKASDLIDTSKVKAAIKASAVSEPVAPAPVVVAPVVAAPVVNEPPVTKAPVAKEPVQVAIKEPVAKVAVVKAPVGKESLVKEFGSASEQPIVKQEVAPVSEEAKSLVAEKDKPIADEVNAWANAWSGKHLSAYFGHYVHGFHGDLPNNKAWRESRKQKISHASSIKVGVSDLKIKSDKNAAEVSFKQSYESGAHQETGHKTLEMKKVKGHWLITKESFK